jgi:hypothetical protein
VENSAEENWKKVGILFRELIWKWMADQGLISRVEVNAREFGSWGRKFKSHNHLLALVVMEFDLV